MKNKLGENIRNLRKSRSITQEQLAEAMGVSSGAVYKWESALSVPDIETIILLAEYFEVSVDVLLGYELDGSKLKAILERMKKAIADGDFENGRREAERALQKYPNHFDVVYTGAMIYFLSLEKPSMHRALELFARSLELIGQNTDDSISEALIYSRMSHIYTCLDEYDKAIELLSKYNFDGHNEAAIGEILARGCRKYDEALPHLSDALSKITTTLLYLCSGYANAYIGKEDYQKAIDIMLWLADIYDGLREEGCVIYLDKNRAVLYAACAECSVQAGCCTDAKKYLKRAAAAAESFDSSPTYNMCSQKFYHGPESARCYDDLGGTAREAVLKVINESSSVDPSLASKLNQLWEEICNEEN